MGRRVGLFFGLGDVRLVGASDDLANKNLL